MLKIYIRLVGIKLGINRPSLGLSTGKCELVEFELFKMRI